MKDNFAACFTLTAVTIAEKIDLCHPQEHEKTKGQKFGIVSHTWLQAGMTKRMYLGLQRNTLECNGC